jgi:hypothetical protein
MQIPLVVISVAALAVCAALLPSRARLLAELGAALLALGHVSIVVAYGLPLGTTPEPIALASLPSAAARIDAALLLLGALLPIAAAIAAWLDSRWKSLVPAALAAAVGTWLLVHHARLMVAAGLPSVVGTTLVIIAVLALARIVSLKLVRQPQSNELVPPSFSGRGAIAAWIAVAAGAVLALLGRNVLLVLLGAVIAAVAMDGLHAAARDQRRANLPWRSLVVLACLGYAAWLLIPIAGPVGLGFSTLADVPISVAAAAMMTPPLAIAALLLAAPFPLSGGGARFMLAPLGAALLARVAFPLLAMGIDGWRTLLLPVGVLLAWIAAVTGRRASLVVAAAWCAGLSAQAAGEAGAILLALALPLAAAAPADNRVTQVALRALAATLAGAGALFALDGLLRVEVFYAVLLWCAWLVIALRGEGPKARVYSGN